MTSDKFPPFRPAAKAVFAEGLAHGGFEIDWILQAATADTQPGPRDYAGGTAFVAPTNRGETRLGRLHKYWLDLKNDCRVFGLFRARKYALLQIKDKYVGALIALVAARMARVPVCYWLAYPHAEASLYAAQERVARYGILYALRGRMQKYLLYHILLPASTHVFVQSEQMRQDLAGEGIALEKMTPVPSSVNLADVARSEADEYTVPVPSGKLIVYLGTLLRERRLDLLVDALERVRRRIPDALLVFVGKGEMPEDEEQLRNEARRLGVSDAMSITGWLPMRTAWQYVRKADVCVSPYFPVQILNSTSPTKLIEYLAFGKPVVGNRHPEQSTVIEASGGGLLCSWDPQSFADAIVRLLENPELARAMGQAGRCYVQQHRTHEVMTTLVASRYREILRGSSSFGSVPNLRGIPPGRGAGR